MILPIVAYGSAVLKKKAKDISKDYPNLDTLIANMWETMYAAHGVGLAAPQVDLSIRLFIVDATPFGSDDEIEAEEARFLEGFKKVFINPEIIKETGESWAFNEGCLSIPDIREDVSRKEALHIRYLDENFDQHELSLNGLAARVVQHEYDHIEGVLFTDYLSPLKKRLLKARLKNISSGKINSEYPMKFPIKMKR